VTTSPPCVALPCREIEALEGTRRDYEHLKNMEYMLAEAHR
jgi:hypothetical protein